MLKNGSRASVVLGLEGRVPGLVHVTLLLIKNPAYLIHNQAVVD